MGVILRTGHLWIYQQIADWKHCISERRFFECTEIADFLAFGIVFGQMHRGMLVKESRADSLQMRRGVAACCCTAVYGTREGDAASVSGCCDNNRVGPCAEHAISQFP